jgi:hypothetical protein
LNELVIQEVIGKERTIGAFVNLKLTNSPIVRTFPITSCITS